MSTEDRTLDHSVGKTDRVSLSRLTADRHWLANYPDCVPADPPIPDTAAWALLLNTAADFPNRAACRYMEEDTSYSQLAESSRRCADALVRMGVKPGDRVGILLPNIPEYPVALNGVWMAGAIAVSISPLSVANEVSDLLKATDCKTVISLDMLAPLVLDGEFKPDQIMLASIRRHMSLVKRLGYSVARWKKIGTGSADGPKRFWMDDELAKSSASFEPIAPETIDAPAYILATGGTTGSPKAVTLSHRNLVANATQVWHWAGARRGIDKMLAVIPFFHSYGLTTCLMTGVSLGATLVMYHRFNPKVAIELLIKERASIFPSVPLMLDQMNAVLRDGKHKVTGLRYVISGGAALPLPIAEEFHDHTCAMVVEGYGLSEASPVTHCGPLDGTNVAGTIGLPLPGTEAKIVNAEDESKLAAPGEVGELLIRGPQVMVGYWNNPEATAKAIDPDGWLRTGDLATCGEDGFFRIVDRKKDLIITSGYNVYPTDVEHTLRKMPGVIDVAVVGEPDSARGELVKAIVAVEDLSSFNNDAFDKLITTELSRHKRPKLIEYIEGDLPRNFLGKVLRRKLRNGSDSQPLNNGPVRTAVAPRVIETKPPSDVRESHTSARSSKSKAV